MAREIPILFSRPMILALRAGRKTVTRRLVRALDGTRIDVTPDGTAVYVSGALDDSGEPIPCPYKAGDRLWVKETWRPRVAHSHGADACDCGSVDVTYAADGEERFFADEDIPSEWTIPKAADKGWVTPLFMPRWASRLVLEIVSVRAERLHDITDDDIEAEGIELAPDGVSAYYVEPAPGGQLPSLREAWEQLWSSINGPASWDANPWVWRVEFRPVLDLNFATYVDRDRYANVDWFSVVVATGKGTTPTPDGGPWAMEYTVPHRERHRLATISESAERMLFHMLRTNAPQVLTRAVELGWFPPHFGATP